MRPVRRSDHGNATSKVRNSGVGGRKYIRATIDTQASRRPELGSSTPKATAGVSPSSVGTGRNALPTTSGGHAAHASAWGTEQYSLRNTRSVDAAALARASVIPPGFASQLVATATTCRPVL